MFACMCHHQRRLPGTGTQWVNRLRETVSRPEIKRGSVYKRGDLQCRKEITGVATALLPKNSLRNSFKGGRGG